MRLGWKGSRWSRIEQGEGHPVDAQASGELRVGVQAIDRQIDDVGAGAHEEAEDPDGEDDRSAAAALTRILANLGLTSCVQLAILVHDAG